MKKTIIISIMVFFSQVLSAQYMIVGKDSISLEQYVKENKYGLENVGIEKTLKNTQDFLLLQQLAEEKKADTLGYFRNKMGQREEELREQYFYPESVVTEMLNKYVTDNQIERQVQIFMVQKSPEDKNDYKKIFEDVKSGKMTMDDAIAKYTKNPATPFYIKPGVLDSKMYDELVGMQKGGYTSLMDNGTYVVFGKLINTRPSLGYVIFGVLSYPNDDKAEALKTNIYNDLKAGKKFQEITKTYGTNDNEKNNGGAVMGSPVLPDEVYEAFKGHGADYYTQPILMEGKYFIFNIYNIEPYKLTDKNKDFFKREMMSSSYGALVRDKLIASLKLDPTFKEFPDFQTVRKSYQAFDAFKNDKTVLYQYHKHNVTFGDFKKDILNVLKEPAKIPAEHWHELLGLKENQDLINFYSEDFMNQKNIKQDLTSAKRNLYSEYIFTDYLRKEVDTHPEWLTEYYNAHKADYMWEKRAKGRVAILADDSMKKEIEKKIKDPANWDALQKEYYGKLNDKNQVLVHFEAGEMAEDADVFKKYGVPFKKGVNDAKIGERTLVVAVDDILEPSQMSFEDSKDLVRDMVTEQKLQETIRQQRAKTNIVIQPAFMSGLEKNFKK